MIYIYIYKNLLPTDTLLSGQQNKGGGAFAEYSTQAEHMNPTLSFPSKFEFLHF